MRLYVDCDETLVFWEIPELPYTGKYKINIPLVKVLKSGINTGKYNVTIWSAGGADWAETVNRKLFKGYDLPSSGKHELYNDIPDDSYAIDDRLKSDRFYLYKFKKVFLPEEFVEFANNSPSHETHPLGYQLAESVMRGD